MDLFTDKADLSGITGQPQHRISQVNDIAFSFMFLWLLMFILGLSNIIVIKYSWCNTNLRRIHLT